MAQFKFIGSIIPPGKYNFSTQELPSISYTISAIQTTIKCDIQIKQSVITVTCEVNEYKHEMLGWYLNYVTDFARAVVQLAGFSLTDFLDVYFYEVITPDGTKLPLHSSYPHLQKLCTEFALDDKFGTALRAVLKEPNLFLALADILPVLRAGTQDIAACTRAIERLRNILSPQLQEMKGKELQKFKKQAWCKLQDALILSQEFIKGITDKLTRYRHGHLKPLTPEERDEILQGTWQIVNRFIAYRMGNSAPLSRKKFSLL